MAWSDHVILRQLQRLEYASLEATRKHFGKRQYKKWIQYPGDIEITMHILYKYRNLISTAISRGVEYEFKNVPRVYTLPQILQVIESEIVFRSLSNDG